MDIAPQIYQAIEILGRTFGGTKVELLSMEMYRQPPCESCALGYLGVDIEVEGIKVFLGCESMAEEIAWNPLGQYIADQFIYEILKEKTIMTVKETYDHITKHMSAENALLKLLEGHVKTYDSLKFMEGEEVHPIMLVSMAAIDMGWGMALPQGSDDEEMQGMMIGTEEYLDEQLDSSDEERLGEALDLIQYFVNRVEAGTIISKTTYKKYKDFLEQEEN